ncbi:MAG TPA: hypothetical protein VN457_00660 [Chlamydiales bacterium]|nr:hypothetical protein [Chlamydiales bacterium]
MALVPVAAGVFSCFLSQLLPAVAAAAADIAVEAAGSAAVAAAVHTVWQRVQPLTPLMQQYFPVSDPEDPIQRCLLQSRISRGYFSYNSTYLARGDVFKQCIQDGSVAHDCHQKMISLQTEAEYGCQAAIEQLEDPQAEGVRKKLVDARREMATIYDQKKELEGQMEAQKATLEKTEWYYKRIIAAITAGSVTVFTWFSCRKVKKG